MRISDWSSDVCSSDLAELPQLRFTQSADTMFLFHRNHKPRLLKRTSASSFALSEFVPREGPFRSLNANGALLITESARIGTVTLNANFDLFTAGMDESLVYLESKEIGRAHERTAVTNATLVCIILL